MNMSKFLLALMILLLFVSQAMAQDVLYVKKVDGLADDFILGMDVSSVISL